MNAFVKKEKHYYCMHICIYIYIPKYDILSPHNVICMNVFMDDHLTLNKVGVFFSGEDHLLLPSFLSCL